MIGRALAGESVVVPGDVSYYYVRTPLLLELDLLFVYVVERQVGHGRGRQRICHIHSLNGPIAAPTPDGRTYSSNAPSCPCTSLCHMVPHSCPRVPQVPFILHAAEYFWTFISLIVSCLCHLPEDSHGFGSDLRSIMTGGYFSRFPPCHHLEHEAQLRPCL